MRLNFWTKTAQAAALAVAVCFAMGSSSSGSRSAELSHRLMCTCGCAEILGECNHVGCTESTTELAMLRKDIDAGMTDDQILSSFVAKYGAVVLAAPPTKGFDLVAWIAPFAVFAAALLGTFLLIRRWTSLPGSKAQAAVGTGDPAADAATEALKEKIRRETDPGNDGGF